MPILAYICRSSKWLLSAIIIVAAQSACLAEIRSAPEYKIKAAFLYNFAVLTEWPQDAFESANARIVIGVVGDDPFGRVLDETMLGKEIRGRKIRIQRFTDPDDAGVVKCHLLFISYSLEQNLERVLRRLKERPILTVAEIESFDSRGGMIWLKKEGDEIKFQVRRSVAGEANLKLSSRLLALSADAGKREKQEVD